MKLIYTNENTFLVNNVKNLLEAQNIPVFIKNEFAQGAVGEISAFDSWPEVWIVNDSDYDKAIEIVELSQEKNQSEEWSCTLCSEKNDASFEVCWNCQNINNQTNDT